MSPNAYQSEHDQLREMLRRFLVAEVQSPRGCGQVGCGAGAALDSLLAAHPVDQRGRCRSCRHSGLLRRGVCRVYVKAHYWLRQPTDRMQAHLAAELGVDVPAPPGVADPEATEVLPRVADDPPTDPLQTPAVPPSPIPPAGQSDPDHGGAGDGPRAPGLAVAHQGNPRAAR
ncbi:MAG TPA: hypothetical protein VK887_11875 [Pseudonocardiaceae bacterium]|nr:hypothetical protein [Pseudonocardiaceae bacterium]